MMSSRLRWIMFAGFLAGAAIAVALPLVAAAADWSWYDDYWEALLISVGVTLALGILFFVLQSATSQEIRQETLRRPAVELSTSTPDSAEPSGRDVTPPRLVEFALEPDSVDVSNESAEIVLAAHLVDEESGLAGSGYPTQVRFYSPTARQFVDGRFEPDRDLVSGSAFDGRYETRVTVPRYAEGGIWKVSYFLLMDQAGNTQVVYLDQLDQGGFPTSFMVTRS